MEAASVRNRGGNYNVVLKRAQQLLPHNDDLNTTTLPIVGSLLSLIGVRENRVRTVCSHQAVVECNAL